MHHQHLASSKATHPHSPPKQIIMSPMSTCTKLGSQEWIKQSQWNSRLTKLLKTINCRQFQAVPCKGRARPPCHSLSNQFECQIILLYIMLAGTWQSQGELAVVQEVNAGVLISHCQLAAKRLACAHTLHCSSTQDSESKTSTISRTKGAGAAAFSCAPQGWGSCRCTGSGDARDEGRQSAKARGRHCHADGASRHDWWF